MTGILQSKVFADKTSRDASRTNFDARLSQVKLDLEARGIAGRLADEFVEQAKVIFDEASDVAQEHPRVVGGTMAALVLWILRNPIIAWLDHLLGPRR